MKIDNKFQFHMSLSILLLLVLLSTVNADCKIPVPSLGVKVIVPDWKSERTRTVPINTIINYECKPGFIRTAGDTDALCVGNYLRTLNSNRRSKPLTCARKRCVVPDIENGLYRLGGTVAIFQCDRGYYLNGSSSIQCVLKDGEYSLEADPPTCEPLPQCPKPVVANSQIKSPCCYGGDVVEIQCNKNYEINGNNFLECLSSGIWNDTLPECDYIATCKDPGISLHGNHTGSCCSAGSVLKYFCDEGFEFENSSISEIECLHSEQWSNPRPKCKPKGSSTCEMPNLNDRNLDILYEKRNESIYKLEVYLSGSEVEFVCKKGYENDDDEFYLACYEGHWDTHIPFCVPKNPCKRPPEPLNGRIAELETDERKEFPVGFEINFECDEGYKIKQRDYGSECRGNDKWSGGPIPNCTKITCSSLGRLENGNVEGDSFYVGDKVKFSCHNGYKLLGSETRICQLNGQWSGELAICDKGDTHCPNPGIPINGYRKGTGFDLDDEVTFTCRRGFYMLGNATRRCLEEHIWSGDEVFCRGTFEFTKIEDASELLEETMAVVARKTNSSKILKNMGRSLVNFDDVNGVNIIFIFDGSGSITQRSFKRAQLFAEALIRKVGLSFENGGTRMAAILFSSDAEVVFQASEVETINEALQKLKEMVPPKKGTDIRKALYKAAEASQLVSELEKRQHSKTVAFLFTDGQSNEGGDPEEAAKRLIENHDVELFCITVGTDVNGDLLKRLVKNDQKHIIHLANYNELFEVISLIADENLDYSKCGLGRSTYIKAANKESLGRLIGGRKVKRSWPWMASLKHKKTNKNEEHKCGGSIIHSKWILTAAHCFPGDLNKPASWKAHVGMVEEEIDNEVSFSHSFAMEIDKIIKHENYKDDTYNFDIALLKLKMPLSFDVFMRPICLPPAFSDLPERISLYQPEESATIVGWGYDKQVNPNITHIIKKAVDHAQELVLPLQSTETCGRSVKWTKCDRNQCKTFTESVTENMICAGKADGKKDACEGDSGGPMMQHSLSISANLTEERWFEVGIVSWGVGCALQGYYGYYTNVAKFRNWIETTTQIKFENVIPLPKEAP